ncbi:MAG TPA: FAD-binding domain-containing protein [Chitinophagaceae bacterium]|nr:FAD-binding domain-containing protein [Chitinophagaceae bacterium]
MQQQCFPTKYNQVIARIENLDPIAYARSRNYVDGAVTYLSPYISRGVISTRQVLQTVLAKGYTIEQSHKLIQELAWREYFQRVWQNIEDDIFEDIRNIHTGITNRKIPAAILEASTGIKTVDEGISTLYETGYMHNHLRMYVASLTCNIARSYWDAPSRWMYYHLLDGDIASNTCSWQWVAGSFSGKQYFANQENINKYTGSQQQGTFLDKSYEELPVSAVPEKLATYTMADLNTNLPQTQTPVLNNDLPLLIYNSYNLDPEWRKEIKANRILLLEPSHFRQFPVSDKVIRFILSLAENIEGIQVFTGEINEIPGLRDVPAVYAKEHTAFSHYPGIKDERDWLFPEVKGLFPSFFSYWKRCEQQLKKYYAKEFVLQRA